MVEGCLYYFIDDTYGLDDLFVNFGILNYIDESDRASFCLLDIREDRIVSSEYVPPTPIDKFQTEEVWHKLPKDWSYKTKLFDISSDLTQTEHELLRNLKITNKEDVYEAFDNGLITLAKNKFQGVVEAEIVRNAGWRLVKRYQSWTITYGTPSKAYRSAHIARVFYTYEEAVFKLNEINKEGEEELLLTDKMWSWKEIEKVLKFFSFEDAAKYRKKLEEMPNIEDLEVRKRNNALEWRYFNKTNWEKLE